jgi:protein required for attachment to host cells
MKIHTWILIADGSRAHVVLNDGIGKGLKPVPDHDFGTAREPAREMGSDSSRHAREPRVDWHRFEKHQFAGAMANILNKAAERRKFSRLVLVALPEILGVLRARLNPRTRKMITAEVGKDLTHVRVHDLPQRLHDVVNL